MKFRQVAQKVIDVNRAVAFYSELLDQQPLAVFDPPGLAFFDVDGVRLFLDVNAASALLYLEVADVREAVEGLRSRGHEIAEEPHIIFPDEAGIFDRPGNEWLAFVRDSEGNMVGLMSREATGS
jgi:methylmalonyl-CoA/ethylmalonyl-CoA epimerase